MRILGQDILVGTLIGMLIGVMVSISGIIKLFSSNLYVNLLLFFLGLSLFIIFVLLDPETEVKNELERNEQESSNVIN